MQNVLPWGKPLAFRSEAFSLSILFPTVLFLTGVSLSTASAVPTHAADRQNPDQKTVTSLPEKITRKQALQNAEKALALAKNEQEASKLWEQTETLRNATLNGATRLLLKAAEEKEATGDLPAMEKLFSTALSLQPDNALLRRFRASTRLKGNDPTGAVQDLAIALQEDPDDPMAWLLLAQSQENLHQYPKALNAFHEVMKRVPALPEKETLLKHFKQEAFGQED